MIEWNLVWCCENPREQSILTSLIFYYLTPPGYIEKTTFDALWAVWLVPPTSELVSFFVYLYGLTPDVIFIEEEIPVDIYRFDSAAWAIFYAFSLTDGFICPEPCDILTFNQ